MYKDEFSTAALQNVLYNPSSTAPLQQPPRFISGLHNLDTTVMTHRRTSMSCSPTRRTFQHYEEDQNSLLDTEKGTSFTRPTREQRLGISPKSHLLKRVFCYCIPARPLHRIICASVLVVVLAAIAVLGWFFFPRFPEIRVNSIVLTDVAGASGTLKVTVPESGDLNGLQLQMSMQMDVSMWNPNLYGLQVDAIDVVANMAVNTSFVFNPLKTQPLTSFNSLTQVVTVIRAPAGYYASNTSTIGTSHVGSIYFPAKTTTNFTMTFALSYTPDPLVGLLNDPTVLELADACGITSRYKPAGRPMKIQYVAKTAIPALRLFNYSPSLGGDIKISCPVSSDQINAVISGVQGGQSVSDAFKTVFGG
ncbi:hypothetical protein HDU79_009780 [Rhizoclosmatium sp. JEL0117]|nr:hypothetical protein HDU79_009780 [Rhizoclosmatium sp. JEL0117]